MTPALLKKLFEDKEKFKKITGFASNKELDKKFITERTGGAVSEEELEMLKKLMSR